MIKRICPVCQTDGFVTYVMGTHAEGRPTIVKDKTEYVQGDCFAHEHCECNKCGGEFYMSYEIYNGKIEYLKVEYKRTRTDSGSHAWA